MAWLLAITWAMAAALDLDTVLEAVDTRVPALAVAEAQLEAAEAKLLATRGAFDPKLKGKAAAYAGKDPRRVLDSELGVSSIYGPRVSMGYRNGQGDFPPYAGDEVTVAEGEWVGRVEVPLLDGLLYGNDRAERDAARWSMEAKSWEVESKRLALRLKASEAYWKWVAAGAKLEVDVNLLTFAEQRASAYEREVEEGSRARIDLLDNERVLFERRDAVAVSRASLAVAAQILSLYYRDDQGRPIVPGEDELPESLALEVQSRELEEDLELAADRPDLRALRQAVQAQQARVRGARNQLLPDLDVSLEHVQPLDGTVDETIGGVNLSVPLLLRKDRGQLGILRAGEDQLEAELVGRQDLAAAEVLATHAELEFARTRVAATIEGQRRAEEVTRLERRRVELGGTEIFTLLLREEKVAKAGKAAVEAQLAARLAEAQLAAVTGTPLDAE